MKHRFVPLLAAALIAFGSASSAQPEAPLIRVGTGQDEAIAPMLYAEQAGLFRRAGLNVHVMRLTNGATAAAALVGGSLEIAKASSFFLVLAHVKGLPFTIIAPVSSYNSDAPDVALLVDAASPIRAAKDFSGKTVAVAQIGDINHVALKAWLDQNGGDSTAVKYIELPASAVPAAVAEGRVVGSPLYEPQYSFASAGGKMRVVGYPYDAIAEHFDDAALYANPAWVNAHRDEVAIFNRVVREANAYVGAHESDVAPLVAQFIGIDPALVTKLHHPGRPLYVEPRAFQPVIDAAAKYKIIPARFDAADLICDCALRPLARSTP